MAKNWSFSGKNYCEDSAKTFALLRIWTFKMRSESEANALLFSAKRSEANSQFRFRFRNNAKFALRMYTPAWQISHGTIIFEYFRVLVDFSRDIILFNKKSWKKLKRKTTSKLLWWLAVFFHAVVEIHLSLMSASFPFSIVLERVALSHVLMMFIFASSLNFISILHFDSTYFAVGVGSASTTAAAVQALSVILANMATASLLFFLVW